MIEWSLAALRASESVGSVVVACPPGFDHGLDDPDIVIVDGGETRAISVSNALAKVETELVAIHDAARPLLTAALVDEVVAALLSYPPADGAIAAAPVTDTVKRVDAEAEPAPATPAEPDGDSGQVVAETVDRAQLWGAQTPQVFKVESLRRALAGDPARVAAATDEASLVELSGGTVMIHPASPENIKVTTPFDLRVAESVLAERSSRPR